MVSGADTQEALVASLLRVMLRALAVTFLAAIVAFTVRGLVIGSEHSLALHWLVTGFLTMVTALLFSRQPLGTPALRTIELTTFFGLTAFLANEHYLVLLEHARAGAWVELGERWTSLFLTAAILMAAYAIFIPNTWRRAALVLLPITILPGAVTWALRLFNPELQAVWARFFNAEHVTFGMILLPVVYAMCVAGTHLISRFRKVAVDASEMGLYSLVKRIGQGGMGEVWLAQHDMLARPAAIKIIRPDLLAEADAADRQRAEERFELEAQATAALRSPNTVQLYDFGVTNTGVFYYVMEYLDGIDLETLVDAYGPVSPERAVHILSQVCASLADAHARGLTHRDIKPANIYTCRMGVVTDFVKVLDFGLVKPTETPPTDVKLTTEGTTTGTPAFMAPELAVNRGVDARADLYALGCVAYWLVTGRLVFDAENALAMVVAHAKETPLPPSAVAEQEIPPELDAIILRCLEKDAAKRYQSAGELSAALAACPAASAWSEVQAREWWSLNRPEAEPELAMVAS